MKATFFDISKLKINLIDFVIGCGILFLKYSTPMASKMKFATKSGYVHTPISYGFIIVSLNWLVDLTTRDGNSTVVRLISITTRVAKNTSQETLFVFVPLRWTFEVGFLDKLMASCKI